MPVSHLTVNYRQGDPEGTHEAMASRLLRDGRGRAYLESKDSAGLLHVAPTEETVIAEAVGEWAANVARSGEGARDHVLIADTNTVVDQLNLRARATMRQMGRLGGQEVICGDVPYSVGDRVCLFGKHVTHQPRVSADGAPLMRADGSPRLQCLTIPKRTRGEVIAVNVAAQTLTVRTDAAGRLPSREVTMTAQEAAGESPQSPVRLGHGYAMTVAIAQARGWSDSYLVLSASRLTGLEQTYTAQTRATRCTHLYAGADRVLGGDMAGDWLEVRDRIKDVLAENLVRPTRKVTTLDYLDPGERAVLEERFASPRQSPPAFDSAASPSQRQLAERLGRAVPDDASWLEASAAVDLAHGHAPGTQAVAWLAQLGIPTQDGWRRVASTLEEQEARNPLPRQPIPSREGRAAAERDPHLAAIEQLLAAPPSEQLDAAERYRRERPLVAASAATSPPDAVPERIRARANAATAPADSSPPASEAARAQAVRSPRPSPGDDIPTVRSPRPSPGDDVPTVEPPGPHGVRAPSFTQEDERRRREELGREAAEQARHQAERQRRPRQS
jgi:hypothetical protein